MLEAIKGFFVTVFIVITTIVIFAGFTIWSDNHNRALQKSIGDKVWPDHYVVHCSHNNVDLWLQRNGDFIKPVTKKGFQDAADLFYQIEWPVDQWNEFDGLLIDYIDADYISTSLPLPRFFMEFGGRFGIEYDARYDNQRHRSYGTCDLPISKDRF